MMRRIHPTFLVVMLSLIMGIQPVTTDLYLPALPKLTDGFGASISQAQFTLTSLLFAFGISQLVWGPVSDRWGRRPVLLIGLAMYSLAAIGSALSNSIEQLILWRTIQGTAMGAVVMCGRAIIRDLFEPIEGARVMSRAMTGLGFIALSGPILGGWLTQNWGWHVALQALTVYGFAMLLLITFQFKETCIQKNIHATEPIYLLRNWWTIVCNPTFRAYMLLTASAFGLLFTFLASSSFVFLKIYQLSGIEYGFILSLMSIDYILGTFLCRYLLKTFSVKKTLAIAGTISAVGGWSTWLVSYLFPQTLLGLLIPFLLAILAHGIHQPIGQSACVAPFPHSAGAASALNGFGMMVCAFGIGIWLGQTLDHTIGPLTQGLAFWGTCLLIISFTLIQTHGDTGAKI